MSGVIRRGKAIRGDLALWDGRNATYTRPDATGGTITGIPVGDAVDVLQVYGLGTSRTRTVIRDAMNGISTSAVTLTFAPGTWTIDDDLTIASNFTCRIPAGCVFSVSSGKTLTFSGDVITEDTDTWYTGSGSVIVSKEGAHGAVYHRTAAERTASVTPTDLSFPPGDIRRYGAATSASAATNTTAVQNAINIAEVGGAAVYVPVGTFPITSLTHDSTNGITIYGEGYQSCLQGALNGTQIMLLIQHASFTAINGFRMQGVRFDANGGGQLDSGVVQINNAVGFVLDQVWVENGTRVSGTSGIGGIVASVGSTGNTGPIGTIRNCYVRNTSKAAINVTSESVGIVVDGCTVRDITGNGTAPGIQVNGGFQARIVNNLIFNTEGRGIYLATDSLSNYPKYAVVANNVIHDTGTGSSEGEGIALTQSFGSDFGRAIIANNQIYNSGVNVSAYGIYLASDANVTITGNHITAAKLYGIRIGTCIDVTVIGNTIDACNTSNTASVGGLLVDGTCDRITIVGNTITDTSASPKQAYGIELAASATLSKVRIGQNNLTGNVTGPILINSTPSEFSLNVVAEKQTSDGSLSTALVLVMADNQALSVNFKSTAKQTDSTNRAFYHSDALFYRNGGGATVQGSISNLSTIESAAGWGGNAVAGASNSAVVQVQGAGGTTINWRVEINAQTI